MPVIYFKLDKIKLEYKAGPNKGGEWLPKDDNDGWYRCPIFMYASGIQPKTDVCCPSCVGDDAGLSDLKLTCIDPNGDLR